jgi:Ca2+:H+ antiporter
MSSTLSSTELPITPHPTHFKNLRAPQDSGMDTVEMDSHDPSRNDPSIPLRYETHRGFKIAKGVRIRPMHILSICWRTASPVSKCVNMLWPLVPIALAIKYSREDLHLEIFILSYLAMIPCANLIGFASQESTRKLPKVLGHLVETVLASTPEMILLLVLLCQKQYTVIQAAILGSILATLLLCLGACFLCGGLIYSEQSFHGAVSELGSDLLLTAYV